MSSMRFFVVLRNPKVRGITRLWDGVSADAFFCDQIDFLPRHCQLSENSGRADACSLPWIGTLFIARCPALFPACRPYG